MVEEIKNKIIEFIKVTKQGLNTPEISNNPLLTQYHYGIIRGLKLILNEIDK